MEGPLSSELLPLSWKRWESSSSEWRKGQSSVVKWNEASPCGSTNLGRQCRPERIENALLAPSACFTYFTRVLWKTVQQYSKLYDKCI